MLLYLLTNLETQTYYQNKPNFNGVYSKNYLFKTKDGAFVINLGEYRLIGILWIALHMNIDDVTYFDSLRNEYIPKESKKFIGNKNIKANVYRIQMHGYNNVWIFLYLIY